MKDLYECPACGHQDTDDQINGHVEQGTSTNHLGEAGWSFWSLRCCRCGEVNDMRQVEQQLRKPRP